MQKRVYIETTIPSFYHTHRTDVESVARMHWTRQWWNENVSTVHLATSAAVIAELRQSSEEQAQARLDLLADLPLLQITGEVERIAQIYINALVMPNDPTGDALHLALASFHKVDILLTWNCAHLANANKIDHIRLVNYELGLPTPLLTTPLNFLSGDE